MEDLLPSRTRAGLCCWAGTARCRCITPNASPRTSRSSGARVKARARVGVGPLDRAGLAAFLPGGLAAGALHSLLTMLTGSTLEYEVQLAGASGRLGWDSCLLSRPETAERAPSAATCATWCPAPDASFRYHRFQTQSVTSD